MMCNEGHPDFMFVLYVQVVWKSFTVNSYQMPETSEKIAVCQTGAFHAGRECMKDQLWVELIERKWERCTAERQVDASYCRHTYIYTYTSVSDSVCDWLIDWLCHCWFWFSVWWQVDCLLQTERSNAVTVAKSCRSQTLIKQLFDILDLHQHHVDDDDDDDDVKHRNVCTLECSLKSKNKNNIFVSFCFCYIYCSSSILVAFVLLLLRILSRKT